MTILLSVNQKWFYFLFIIILIFWHIPILPYWWIPCDRHYFLAYMFWNDLCCLYLSYQAISLTWRIVWESALPKLSSSRLILLRSIVLIPISSLKNVTKSEPESTKTISLLENRASSSYSSILFVTKQSRTNFNAGR